MKQIWIHRLVLAGLWILSLVGISFYGGTVSYGFFFGVTLVPVISLVYLILVYFRFRIYQKIDGRAMVCGQPMSYYFVLQNDDYFAFSGISVRLFAEFSSVETLSDDNEYEVLPGDKHTFETTLVCRYRGEYEVGVREIVVTDFFRLFRLRYKIRETIKAIVNPRIVRVSTLNSVENLPVLLQRDFSSGGTEPDVVARDYMAGDALKQIHWKLAAREQKLKTRNRIDEEKQGISIFLDTGRYHKEMAEYLPVENKLLETTLALGVFLAEHQMAFTAYYGQKGMVQDRVDGIRDFENFYRKMSGIVFDEDEDMAETFFQAVEQGLVLQTRVLFCVVHSLPDAFLTLSEQLTEAGMLIVIYVITEENIEEYVRLSNERRKIIAIPAEAELEGRL